MQGASEIAVDTPLFVICPVNLCRSHAVNDQTLPASAASLNPMAPQALGTQLSCT